MIVYWSVFIWAFAISSFINQNNKKLQKDKITYNNYSFTSVFAVFFLLWLFSGFRTGGVGDTLIYIDGYKKISTVFHIPKYSSSFLFDLVRNFCKAFISSSSLFWLLLLDTAAMIPLCLALSRFSIDIQISACFFILSGCFEYFFNGSRQLIAIALCMYATKYLVDKKTLKYVILVLIASLIHGSAILMLVGIILFRIKPWSRAAVLIVFVTVSFIILPKSIIEKIISDAVEGTDYSIYSREIISEGLNPIRVLTVLVPPFLAFSYKAKIAEYNDPFLNYCVNTSLVTALLYLIGLFINGLIAARIGVYFIVFNAFLYPYLLNLIVPNDKKVYRYLFIGLYIIFFAYQMYFSYGGLPYESSILGIYV